MDLIVTLIIGGIVGWLASIVMGTNAQMGILANIAIGVIGSVIGHFVGSTLGVEADGGLTRWAISLLGAVLLIGLLRMLGVFRRGTVVDRR
jgi:uncharacterized membrane protein YeaQ/YmgE (transglycosylase-associated protein family)